MPSPAPTACSPGAAIAAARSSQGRAGRARGRARRACATSALLDPRKADPDLADEMVRKDLGLVRPDEVSFRSKTTVRPDWLIADATALPFGRCRSYSAPANEYDWRGQWRKPPAKHRAPAARRPATPNRERPAEPQALQGDQGRAARLLQADAPHPPLRGAGRAALRPRPDRRLLPPLHRPGSGRRRPAVGDEGRHATASSPAIATMATCWPMASTPR